jgi:hypothetical protein
VQQITARPAAEAGEKNWPASGGLEANQSRAPRRLRNCRDSSSIFRARPPPSTWINRAQESGVAAAGGVASAPRFHRGFWIFGARRERNLYRPRSLSRSRSRAPHDVTCVRCVPDAPLCISEMIQKWLIYFCSASRDGRRFIKSVILKLLDASGVVIFFFTRLLRLRLLLFKATNPQYHGICERALATGLLTVIIHARKQKEVTLFA